MSDAAKEKSTKVVTPEATASYVTVFTPQEDDKGNKKYSIALVFYPSKETEAFRLNAKKAGIIAGRKKFGEKFDAMVKGGSILLEGGRGALLRTDSQEKYPGSAFYVNARNSQRPGVVDADMNPIIDGDEFYSGVVCRAALTAFGYDREGNKGLSWSLGNLQKVRDGERLDNRSKPGDDFAPLAGGADAGMDDLLS